MDVGTVYSPWKMFRGALVPDWLFAAPISHGAKLCYSLLARYSGKDGKCFPGEARLAKDLNVSERQVRRYLDDLEDNQLIQSRQRGQGKTNCYVFLWHSWITEESLARPKSPDDPDEHHVRSRPDMSGEKRSAMSTQDRTAASGPHARDLIIPEESHVRESGRDRPVPVHGTTRETLEARPPHPADPAPEPPQAPARPTSIPPEWQAPLEAYLGRPLGDVGKAMVQEHAREAEAQGCPVTPELIQAALGDAREYLSRHGGTPSLSQALTGLTRVRERSRVPARSGGETLRAAPPPDIRVEKPPEMTMDEWRQAIAVVIRKEREEEEAKIRAWGGWIPGDPPRPVNEIGQWGRT